MRESNENGPQESVTPLEYARTIPGMRTNRTLRVVGIVLASVLGCIVLGTIFLPSLNRRPDQAPRVKCASNMKQIGLAIEMYAMNEHGHFPDDLDTLLETQDLTTSVVNCPSSNDAPAVLPTSQPVGTKFLTSGHVSYIYVGKGLNTQTATPDVVLLYEPLGNHSNSGMNVLFGDFHVEWLSIPEVQPILKQVAAGVFPIRLPPATTQPLPNP